MEQLPNTPYRELKGGKQIAYAVGHLGPGMLSQFITTWLLLFMTGNADNPVLSGTLVGTATLVGRIVDGVADPMVANWSDNIRGKWMAEEWGKTGINVLQQIKNVIDPNHIMNPGKIGLR